MTEEKIMELIEKNISNTEVNIYQIINNVKDIDILKNIIIKYKDELNIIYIITRLQENKIKLLKKIDNYLTNYELSNIIITINDEEELIKLIKEYEKRFQIEDISYIISTVNQDELKIKLIDIYEKKLKNFNYVETISRINSLKLKIQIIKKYNERITNEQITTIIKKSLTNEIPQLISAFKDRIKHNNIAECISVLSDEKQIKREINKYQEELDSNDFKIIIYEQIDDVKKQKLLDTYIDRLDNEDFNEIVISMYETERKVKTIIKYKDKFDLSNITHILNNIESQAEQIAIIEEIKKVNKTDEKTSKLIEYIQKLYDSNSSEIQHVAPYIIQKIGNLSEEEQNKIIYQVEQIFLTNNLPIVAKIYKVFEIMHPTLSDIEYISPNLNQKNSLMEKKQMIFSDLVRCSLGSNNRSMKKYINNIKIGNEILEKIIKGFDFQNLSNKEKEILSTYIKYLNMLYNNTTYGIDNPRILKNNIQIDSLELISLFLKNEKIEDVNKLPDKIIRLFLHYAGFNTVQELEEYSDKKIKEAEARNIKVGNQKYIEVKKGDFIKGLVNDEKLFYSQLQNILQNGSVCKEFLGNDATSDTTPLDTDLSKLKFTPKSMIEIFSDFNFEANCYGPVWIIIKNDNRFNYSQITGKYIKDKLEVFKTLTETHYGVRTGFASSDIDCFVVDIEKVNLQRIEYEIVMNGFYIPIVNMNGKIIFKPNQYEEIKKQMSGLKYYSEEGYIFAKELDNFEITNHTKSKEQIKKEKIEILKIFQQIGLNIILGRGKDNTPGTIELIDTGSTSRGTNKNDSYDYDFIMRIDKKIFNNRNKMKELLKKLKKIIPKDKIELNNIRNAKLKINVDGQEKEVNIDITLVEKDEKITYTTDECIKDRLETIKKIDREKYEKVIQNIILAKKLLKDVYKKKNSRENPQGGLGGVGIESWILQNGGSLEHAAKTFLEAAENSTNFEEFKMIYKVWNFGQNYMYFINEDEYLHDEFISDNMTEEGYKKMVKILKIYLSEINNYRSEKRLILKKNRTK